MIPHCDAAQVDRGLMESRMSGSANAFEPLCCDKLLCVELNVL